MHERRPDQASEPAVTVRWIAEDCDEEHRLARARVAVAIVFGITQPSVLGPKVMRPRAHLSLSGRSPALGTAEEPISYVQLRENWTWTGFSPAELAGPREPSRAPLPMSDLLRMRDPSAVLMRVRPLPRDRRRWKQVNPSVRPGEGGRRPKANVFTVRSAAQECYDSLGEPVVLSHKGAQIMIWDARERGDSPAVKDGLLDPAGTTMAFARLSGDEVQKGETLGFHVQSALDLATKEGRKARWVMASVDNSGYQRFEDRKDLLKLERLIEQGDVNAVSVLHVHRLARERLEMELTFDLLRSSGVDLYVCAINRKIDWHTDDGLLASWAMAASQEGKWIKERTLGAIVRRFLLEGRGWPGSIRFGTKRDAQKFAVEDPVQMRIVHWLHNRYLEICEADGGQGGLRRLQNELKKVHSTHLSHERIRTILMDPLYVTGEWHVTYQGYAISCKPVVFSTAVPRTTYQRTQEFLKLRGKPNSVTPLGYFLLNYIPFLHADCMGERSSKSGHRIMLRGEVTKDGDRSLASMTYRHRPQCPDGCRGLLVPKEEIDAAVVREVKRVLRSRFLQAAAAEATARAAADDELDNGRTAAEAQAERARELRQSLARIQQTEESTKRRWLDGIGAGTTEADDWQEMLGEIRVERKRLEQQLAYAERDVKNPRRRQRINTADRDGYLKAVDAILTEETPDDLDHRVARAALIKALLSAVILHHDGPDSGYTLELKGWLVPEHESADDQPDALSKIKGRLDAFAAGGMAELAATEIENQRFSGSGCVKQDEACLTQPEARQLVEALQHQHRPPPEFAHARVANGEILSKIIVDPDDLDAAAFTVRLELPGPFPQPRGTGLTSAGALMRIGELAEYADIGYGGLMRACSKGRLRHVRIGSRLFSTRDWLDEYAASRHPGLSKAGRKRSGSPRRGTNGAAGRP